MKILDIDSFIVERMRFRPVTNAEWDKIRKETLAVLPLKYENILVPGNVLTIEINEKCNLDYIVIPIDDINPFFNKKEHELYDDLGISNILVNYNLGNNIKPVEYFARYESSFMSDFPNANRNWYDYKIIKIRGTIKEDDFHNMKAIDDLKKIYVKYHLTYE